MEYLTKKENVKIYLISDTHLIANQLHDNGEAFQKMRDTSAGKDLDYQNIALKAFVRKIMQDKPNAVVITGDLTFNGEKISAEKLAKIFQPIAQAGIAFLVLPGNHDIYDGWARKFEQERQIRIAQNSPNDWKKIFSNSYKAAYHFDPSSLSYSVNLNPDYRLILLDSNIYGDEFSYSYPITNGRLNNKQLTWIKNEIKDSYQNKQKVLFFMHHNLYVHNSVIHGGFVLDNTEDLQKIFSKYQIPVVFSGHIHAQNIAESTSCPTIEVASSCFSMTDQGYGIISLSPKKINYQRQSFEMNKYLTAEEIKLLPNRDFHQYLFKIFTKANTNQTSWLKNVIPNAEEREKILSFINQCNWNFFIGKSFYTQDQLTKIKNSHVYQDIKQKLPEMKNYLDSLLTEKRDSWHFEIKFK